MINVILLSLVQAPLAEPQTAPKLRRAETTIVSPNQLNFPDEIAPMVMEYLSCLHPKEGLRSDGMGGFEAALRRRMQSCRPTRDWAVSSAVTPYKVDRKKPGGAQEQVTKIFDDVDAAELRDSSYVDEQFRTQMGLPPTTHTPAKPDETEKR